MDKSRPENRARSGADEPLRTAQGHVQPGTSSNPGGRPKGLTAALKERYGEDADKLVAIDRTLPPRVRLQVIGELLDRGWGRPAQSVDLTAWPMTQPIIDGHIDTV